MVENAELMRELERIIREKSSDYDVNGQHAYMSGYLLAMLQIMSVKYPEVKDAIIERIEYHKTLANPA